MKKETLGIVNVASKGTGKLKDRVLIGTPTTGLVRMEWVMGRYGQSIPTNWGHVEFVQFMSSYIPISYQVADAENLIAKAIVEGGFEWLLFIEHDNVLPANTFLKLNQYMIKGDTPVVAGLYFTKGNIPEPMVYRDFGQGYYADWKMGDKVWVKGLPFGCTLIHSSLIKEIWKTSPEYKVGDTVVRRVFKHPDPLAEGKPGYYMTSGTTDLAFCKEVIENDILRKCGWKTLANEEYPFLVDTSIFVKHIDNDGIQYPVGLPQEFLDGKVSLKSIL